MNYQEALARDQAIEAAQRIFAERVKLLAQAIADDPRLVIDVVVGPTATTNVLASIIEERLPEILATSSMLIFPKN